jgi:hypothetical protein
MKNSKCNVNRPRAVIIWIDVTLQTILNTCSTVNQLYCGSLTANSRLSYFDTEQPIKQRKAECDENEKVKRNRKPIAYGIQ